MSDLRERLIAAVNDGLQMKQELDDLRAQLAAKDAEIERLKTSLATFVALWAVPYSKDYGLDGLHPTHYDLLKECGARMDDFKRAEVSPAPSLVERVLEADSKPPEATFKNADEMMAYLDADDPATRE